MRIGKKHTFDNNNHFDKIKYRVKVDERDKPYYIGLFENLKNIESDCDYNPYQDMGGYRHCHFPMSGIRIGQHKSGKYYMIEFNPSNLTEETKGYKYVNIITRGAKKSLIDQSREIEIKRVDIAQDHFNNLGAYKFDSTRTKKKVKYEDNDKLETLYIGARTSNMMYRIYDKVQEIRAKEKEDFQSPMPIWRVECELKNDAIEEWIEGKRDPFKDLNTSEPYNNDLYAQIQALEGTLDNKNLLFVHITQNIALKDLTHKNRASKINKMKKALQMESEPLSLNLDTANIKRKLRKFIFNGIVEYLL